MKKVVEVGSVGLRVEERERSRVERRVSRLKICFSRVLIEFGGYGDEV